MGTSIDKKQLTWNDSAGTYEFKLKGGNVTLQIGQEQVARVVNKTSPLINLLESNYQVVLVTGATGQRLSVRLAKADSDANSAGTLGIVTEDIAANQEGFITTNGQVHEINTSGSLQGETWNDGDILYLSGTVFGGITNVKPVAPIHTVIVGYVEYAHAVHGKIFVKIDNGYELDELHNVLINNGTLANNDVLTYESATQLWKNKPIAPSSGVWGISNTSGVYTYYTTLTLAMATASSGQVIELFADVTESSNVTISLKHGVNINGNGHTYTYTNNSGTMFSCATSGPVVGTIIIENLNIVRTNTASTGASIFTFTGSGGYATTKLYLPGSYITYTVTSGNSPVITATDALNSAIIDGLFCITNGAGTAVNNPLTTNSYIECTGTSIAFSTGTIRNSRITTTSGTAVSSGTAISCVISCTTSGIGVNEGNAYNCYISTNTGNCMQAGSSIAQGVADSCTLTSTSGICFRRVLPSNCVASSGSNLVVDHWFNYGGAKFHRNYFATTSTSPVFACAGGTMELVDSTIIQNGTGPGVRVTGASNQDVINCTIIVASSAANCLNATAASNSRYINNKFKGATTPVSANVTQTVTNTIDNQGNILL